MEVADTIVLERLAQPAGLRRSRDVLLDASRPTWSDARLVVFDIAVAREVAAAWLPRPLRLPTAPTATIFVADYPSTSFGVAYRECGVLLHARLRGTPVLHCAWMSVDDDTAMILGRELLGFPKKMAGIDLLAADGWLRASVTRRGAELLHVEGRLGTTLAAARAFEHPIANVRGNPGLAPAVLWRMTVPERFHHGAAAELDVRIGGSPYDPLDRLSRGARCGGRWLCVDLGVPPAKPGPIPRGVYPAGLVSPLWLARMYPFRTM